MELTAEKRNAIANDLACFTSFDIQDATEVVKAMARVVSAMCLPIAASEPATIKAGDGRPHNPPPWTVDDMPDPLRYGMVCDGDGKLLCRICRNDIGEFTRLCRLATDEIAKRDAELAALREKLAATDSDRDQWAIQCREAREKLAELRAAVDKWGRNTVGYGDRCQVFKDGVYSALHPTLSAACLAAHRAEHAEVKHD